MSRPSLDYWFTMGSTYNYLTAMRIQGAATAAGVEVVYRPVRNVAALTGAQSLPFIDGTTKYRYMWRDIERRALSRNLPLRLPVTYPSKATLLANKVAQVATAEGWAGIFLRAAYPLWFAEGKPNGTEGNLRAALIMCGHDFDRVLALANAPETQASLDAATDAARALGVFGSPTFAIGPELFWGDDHLEDAIAWAKTGRLAR